MKHNPFNPTTLKQLKTAPAPTGKANRRTSLTKQQEHALRILYMNNISASEAATIFGITRAAVSYRYKTYRLSMLQKQPPVTAVSVLRQFGVIID